MTSGQDMGEEIGDCREAVHRLYHYLDGMLDEALKATIERHLDACPPCGEAFSFEEQLRKLVARKCQDCAPEQLQVRIFLAIQRELGPEEGGTGGIRPR